MKDKVLLTATVQSHIAQFHRPLIRMLKEHGYEVHIAAGNNLAEKNGLKIDKADKIFDIPFSRSPKSRDNIKAYKQLKSIIDTNGYSIIHCNTPMGGIVTRLAAREARKNGTKVFYTAHGFHFYKGAPKQNWLIYYPIEKRFARYTDKLLTINREDYETAKSCFATEVYHTHGVGADESRYNTETKADSLREDLGYTKDDFVVLCTGELNKNKNQGELIKAIAQIKDEHVKAVLAGNGPNEDELKGLVSEYKLEDRVKLVGYRTDLERFVKMSDAVVSMSIREGLGLNVIEAMLCGKPVVVADNRGHRDLVEDGVRGFMVGAHDNAALSDRIIKLYSDESLCRNFGRNGMVYAQTFTMSSVAKELETIYFG